MKNTTVFALLAVLAGASAASTELHPVAKVINLLKDLKEKAITAGKAEEAAYTKFAYWCKTSTGTLKKAIAEEKENLEEVRLDLKSLESQNDTLTSEINNLNDQILQKEAAASEAKADRKGESSLYSSSNKDYTSTIKALAGALKAMNSAESRTEGGLALAQTHVRNVIALVSTKATEHEIQALAKFAKPTSKAKGDLAAHVDNYDFKSENVVELLKSLQMDFQDKQLENHKDETNSLNSYSLAKQSRDNAIAAEDKSKKGATVERKGAQADFTGASKNEISEEKDLEADSASEADTKEQCDTKRREFEDRTATRQSEIEAMDAAIEILGKAANVRTKAPNNPGLPASPTSFLQVSEIKDVSNPKMKAVALIRQAGQEAHSKALERLAQEVQAHLNSPFDTMNAMVQKMIFRLMNEQKDEDEHKLWCDKEISKSETMKEDKRKKLFDHNADLKVENAAVAQLQNDITDANEMINDMNTFMQQATEIRATGKMENKLAVKDSVAAQNAVANAIAVLEGFYKDTGAVTKEDWEFIQAPVKLPKDPKLWSSPAYTSSTKNPAKTIIAVLKTLGEKFDDMKAKTEAQEAVDQKDFDKTMKDNKIEKARRTQEVEMKDGEMKRRRFKVVSLNASKKDVTGQFDKTVQYLTDIKSACVNGDSSYADRKAARTKEAKGLRAAQDTLTEAFKPKPAKSARSAVRVFKPRFLQGVL